MGDADASYNFGDALMMIRKISEGQDLVMGNRFGKPMEKNAMPLLNRYLGNPVLSFLGRLFYKVKIRDFHCGLRAFRKSSLEALRLNGLGMEFASEMVIKASIFGLKIQEVPIYFRKDQRTRSPHLRRWRDGWRHLRILLTFSPNYLFAAPALIFIFFGMAMAFFGQSGNLLIGEIALSYRSSLILAFLVAMSSLMYGLQQTLTDVQSKMRGTSGIRNAAHTMIIGVTTSVIGFLLIFREFLLWRSLRYSTLETGQPLLLFTWGISLLLFGVIQIIFYVFRKVLSEHDVTETGAP